MEKIKKSSSSVFAFLFIVLGLSCIMSISTFAQATTGYCGANTDGKNISWSLENGVMTLSGSGKMKDGQVLGEGEHYDVESIVVGNGITSIGKQAFAAFRSLETVSLPNTIEVLGESCFYDCNELSTVDFPSSVKTINRGAFAACYKLKDIDLSNVEYIGSGAFTYCRKITYADVSNAKTIGYSAFEWCVSLETVVLPSSLTEIPFDLFLNCQNLKNLNLPDTVTKVGKNAFSGCEKLQLELPPAIEEIGDYAFGATISEKNIVLPETVKVLGESAIVADRIVLPVGLTQMIYTGNLASSNTIIYCTNSKHVDYCSDFGYTYIDGTESRNIENCNLVMESTDNFYAGSDVEPKITVTYRANNKTVDLIEGFDYELNYTGNDKLGSAKATVTGINFWSGSLEQSFDIYGSADSFEVQLSESNFQYDGTAKRPEVSVKFCGSKLVEGTDYEVSYQNNIEPGSAIVMVTGKGYYKGSISKTFTIYKNSASEQGGSGESGGSTETTQTSGEGDSQATAVEIKADQFYNTKSLDSWFRIKIPANLCTVMVASNNVLHYSCEVLNSKGSNIRMDIPAGTTCASGFPNSWEITLREKYNSKYAKLINMNRDAWEMKDYTSGSVFQEGDYLYIHITADDSQSGYASYAGYDFIVLMETTNFKNQAKTIAFNTDVRAGSVLHTTDYYKFVAPFSGKYTLIEYSDDNIEHVKLQGGDGTTIQPDSDGIYKLLGGATYYVCTSGAIYNTTFRVNNQRVSYITLSDTSVTLNDKYNSFGLSATAYPENAVDRSVTFESSDPSVVSVSSTGWITGKKEGKATITVKANDGSGVSAKCVVVMRGPAKVGDKFDSGKIKYKITSMGGKKTVAVIGVNNTKSSGYKIPATVKYDKKVFKVLEIQSKAFSKCKNMKKLEIGSNVQVLKPKALMNCKKLKTIMIKSKSLNTVGKNALKGINKKAVIKVPSSKKKEYVQLFSKKGQSKTVKIK